jgi:hypothetical protein
MTEGPAHRRPFHALSVALAIVPLLAIANPLPSWNDSGARATIIEFVESVTDPASDAYVTPADRIAVFDNDGTLWSEKPIYFQGLFAIDRLREMAAEDEDILRSDVLRAAVQGDLAKVAAAGEAGLLEILAITHSGLTVDSFVAASRDWMAGARHPGTGMAYDDMVYQPMLELLRYLRDEGFSTWIVSGGGLHFIRAFAEQAYNIPPQQVIGTTGKASYVVTDGEPAIMKDPSIFFIDDKAGKPLAIDARIGKRPILAAGNSDGDFQMLEWTTSGEGPRLGILIHHTDGEREFAYDRDSHVGRLARGLDEGPDRGWLTVDMSKDWARIWPAR